MFFTRLLSSLLIIPLIIIVTFWLNEVCFNTLVLIIFLLAAWEWGGLSGFLINSQRSIIVFIFTILLAILCWFLLLSTKTITKYQILQIILCCNTVWWLITLYLIKIYPHGVIIRLHSRFLRLFFGLVTLIPFCCSIILLRGYGRYDETNQGAWYLMYVLIPIWGADSGAYFLGKTLGKHTLIPAVSPGKTWEGLFAGVFTAIILNLLLMRYGPLVIKAPLKWFFCSTLSILGSVIGDLTESMFKRIALVKESGCIIPGHGGILDRIDSLTSALPLFTFLALLFGLLHY